MVELLLGDVPSDDGHELRVHFRRGSDDIAAVEPALVAGEVGDDASGFGDEERAGGDVPRCKVHLEKAVEDSGGGVGEIECSRPGPADAFGDADDVGEDGDVALDVLLRAKGEAGGEE